MKPRDELAPRALSRFDGRSKETGARYSRVDPLLLQEPAPGSWSTVTDRATYWCIRAVDGGETFVPSSPNTPFQIVDGRDTGLAAAHAATAGHSGVYNVVSAATTRKNWLDMSARSPVAARPRVCVPNHVFANDQL